VGFGFSPVSILTMVFKAKSAFLERRSCDIPIFGPAQQQGCMRDKLRQSGAF
jgi:hypothetical protein